MHDPDQLNLSESEQHATDTEAVRPPADPSNSSQSSLQPRWLIGLLMSLTLAVLLLTGSIIVLFFRMHAVHQTQQLSLTKIKIATPDEPSIKPLYFRFDEPFIVRVLSMEEKGSEHYLRIELSLLTDNPKVLKVVQDNQPLFRHELQALFSEQVFENLKKPGAYEQLRKKAEIQLGNLLKTLESPTIKKVLFTAVILE